MVLPCDLCSDLVIRARLPRREQSRLVRCECRRRPAVQLIFLVVDCLGARITERQVDGLAAAEVASLDLPACLRVVCARTRSVTLHRCKTWCARIDGLALRSLFADLVIRARLPRREQSRLVRCECRRRPA